MEGLEKDMRKVCLEIEVEKADVTNKQVLVKFTEEVIFRVYNPKNGTVGKAVWCTLLVKREEGVDIKIGDKIELEFDWEEQGVSKIYVNSINGKILDKPLRSTYPH